MNGLGKYNTKSEKVESYLGWKNLCDYIPDLLQLLNLNKKCDSLCSFSKRVLGSDIGRKCLINWKF